MREALSSYPPNPERVPDDLTELNWPYFFRALLVLGTLTVFVIFYLALVAGSGYLCYASLMSLRGPDTNAVKNQPRTPTESRSQRTTHIRRVPPVLAIAGMIASGLLCLFLLKGFFKFRKKSRELEVEITEKDQPSFFAFLRQLCRDTGAPMPRRVFLVPEVNAAVVYNSSPFALFLPTSKNLLVGLGLVNQLNVTEFKAVLAHEFGHFSQSSMKLGAYVYQANNIIADMVYGRDFFDDILDHMRNTDDRLDLFVKGFTGVIWALRKALEGIFHVINFANSSLSRQMEFNADLVAVRVTGSDAIVHALARLDFANDALDQALKDLTDASDHQVYTRDLFFHQTQAAGYLKQVHHDPKLGEVPALPEDAAQTHQVFQPGDDGIPLMWATHPSNFDREKNAKRLYVRGVTDERPSWILFDQPALVRAQVTRLYYEMVHKVPAERLAEPETVKAFIDEEHAETTYPERVHGMYDDRYLDLVGLELWVTSLEMRDPDHLRELHAELYGPEVKALVEKKQQLQEEHTTLQKLAGQDKSFTFRAGQHSALDVPQLLATVERELADTDKRLGTEDRKVYQVHYAMAEQCGEESAAELKMRYQFHAGVQEILSQLAEACNAVDEVMGALAGQRQLSESYFQRTIQFFQETHLVLKTSLDKGRLMRIPALKNLTDGQRLSEFLLTEPLVSYLSNGTQTLDSQWIDRLCKQLGEMLDRSRRIHFKSLGGIIALQDQIASAWLNAHQNEGTTEAGAAPVSEAVPAT